VRLITGILIDINFIVVAKKTFRYPNVFSTIETFVSTKEIFISSTSYAPILYTGTFLWKRVYPAHRKKVLESTT
jgi:hypothetical protein